MVMGRSLQKAIEAVLNIARWAPSGDNAQPWRFRIKSDGAVEILVSRANPSVYEYREGEPTLISAGALLANIELAAPAFGLRAAWQYVGSSEGVDHIQVDFREDSAASVPDLFDQITRRSVDRRPFRLRALDARQKDLLAGELNPGMQVQWYESLSERWRIAALSGLATNIRLTIPEAFGIHRDIVDWNNRESAYAIPSRALGLDPLTLRLTRWSMANWGRTKLMNGLGAPQMASVQMDFLPGLFSAAYFVIRLERRSQGADAALVESLEVGRTIQRFWLRASKLGLVMQPCVAMLAFWSYAEAGQAFTVLPKGRSVAHNLAGRARATFGAIDDVIFLGRMGWPRSRSASRSTRLPLSQLMADGGIDG